MTALIIHGHFYQPPRENPWTGEIDPQPSAAPFHDWNERVFAECYGPNAAAAIGGDVPERTINNYANISFNFGPTLLSWMERHHPDTYQLILGADATSAAKRGGHGNAIAQAYGHAILPLCNERDRLTQVVWGLADFRFRFGREPESMWLPETAANNETLRLLSKSGVRYVILAPDQAKRVRSSDSDEWTDVSGGRVDTTKPYLFHDTDGSNSLLVVFFYHGPLARAIAFEKALVSSRGLVENFIRVAQTGTLVNVATDGETYGHHFKFGDLCLAHALEVEAKEAGFWITNYGEYLDSNPPTHYIEIDEGPLGEGSSWSCAHGVGRWIRDCGCHTGGEDGWTQRWRGPLRAALEFLRDDAALKFEELTIEILNDPWAVRNEYISILLGSESSSESFIQRYARRLLTSSEVELVMTLLEIQRNSLLMFTSCGWFFSDLSGIETIQVLRYAARVMDLQDQLGLTTPREKFLQMLAEAKSNVTEKGNGADIFRQFAEHPFAEVE
jgi:alpha-amylase/alpha-mannosidase (GH57 family)